MKILKLYCDLAEMFSESKINNSSLHCEQNHVIDLINKQTSSFDFIYNLSEKKFTELQRYLNKNLKNNFI